jgi:deazaflavin-dependent oxidoreductase (nitroreductase family)
VAEDDPTKPAFRKGPTRRVGNVMITPLIRAGLVPHTYLLTTRGRRTGRPHTNPVTLVEHGEQRWLVAPYGTVDWVHNARAAGRVSLRRGRRTLERSIRELDDPHEAAPILKEYLSITGPPRRYFSAKLDDPVEQFAAEALAHPVFELLPVG